MDRRQLVLGLTTAGGLLTLMLALLLAPLAAKPSLNDESATLRADFQAIGAQLVRVNRIDLVITLGTSGSASVNRIHISGQALEGRTITVASIDDFSRLIATFDSPGTAVVGVDPSIGALALSPPPAVAQVQEQVKRILAVYGFSDPVAPH